MRNYKMIEESEKSREALEVEIKELDKDKTRHEFEIHTVNYSRGVTGVDKSKTEKIAEDFMIIFNAAWARFPGIPKITKKHSLALLNQMKPIMDNRLVHIAYYKEEPIGFFIMMQDISQITKDFKGRLSLYHKLKLLFKLRLTKSVTRVVGRLFGVVPDHQGKGVEGGLVVNFANLAKKPGFQYTDLELNWIGDFNPTMMKVCEQIGSKIYKTHITYRYLFDRDATFERAKKVNI